jgi:plastocyanin
MLRSKLRSCRRDRGPPLFCGRRTDAPVAAASCRYTWTGIVEWFGVLPSQLPTVLPNLRNFATAHRTDAVSSENLFTDRSGQPTKWFVQWTIPTTQTAFTVAVGDTVTFDWHGAIHDVQLVPDTTCNFGARGVTVLAAAAASGSFVFTASATGTFHLACGVGPHCSLGMLVTITVW